MLFALNWTVRLLSCRGTDVEPSWRSLLGTYAMVFDGSELEGDSPVLGGGQAVVLIF